MSETNTAIQPATRVERGIVQDDGQFSALLDTNRFEHLWRVAKLFSGSELVPDHFKGKVENCFIGISMAIRLGVDPFMFLQNTYIVHGRPGMEAKLAIALINSSGLYTDSIEYEIVGEDAAKPDYKVRAFATRKSTGKTVYGPWITWAMVKAERWDSKEGSKWKTMPGQMFLYRAATFFGRVMCPERLMGMQTADELYDAASEADAVAKRATRGVKALTEKLVPLDVPHPTEPAQVIDEPTSNAEPENPVIRESQITDELPDLSTWESFYGAMESLAVEAGITPVNFGKAMDKLRLGDAGSDKKSVGPAARSAAFVAAKVGGFNWAKGEAL